MQTWYLISECWNRKYLMKVHLKFWRTNMTRWGGRCRDCEIKACNFPSIYQTLIGWGEIETKLKFAWNVNNLDLNTEISHAMFSFIQEPSEEKHRSIRPSQDMKLCLLSIYDCYTHVMKFIIKTTGITDRLSVLVSSPQSGCCGLTVGTAGPFPSGWRLKRRKSSLENQEFIIRSISSFDEISFSDLKNNIEKVMLTYANQLTKGWSH